MKSKLFSGTKAQREGSGGGVDVTALSSFPRKWMERSLTLSTHERLNTLTDDVVGEMIEVKIVLVVSERI